MSSTAQAVVNPSAARIVGFEQPTTDWSGSGVNVQTGSQFTEGQHSAAVTVSSSGGMLTSVPISSFGTVSPVATLQVRLPSYLLSQTWQGQLALHLNAPSAGVFSQYVGPAQFSGAQTGVFRQAQFTLPDSVVSGLSTHSFNDLTVSVEFDFPPNPNPTRASATRFTSISSSLVRAAVA